jgi:calcium-dependent protein kinase
LLEKNKDLDQIKIIDFGVSVYQKGEEYITEKIGTPYYIAPEVLTKKYGPKCDVWSCGIIAYVLLCGGPPFNGDSDKEILKKVKAGKIQFNGEIWLNVSFSAKDFIQKLLNPLQKRRPTA